MMSQNSIPQELLDLRNQNQNFLCVDCSSANPDFVSTTYGIFICNSCYQRHKSLGPSISKIRDLQSKWSLEDIKVMQTGGNSAFITFLSYYKIALAPIEYKYRTSAAAYYKDMLDYLSKGHEYNRELLTISKGQEEISQVNLTPYEVVEIDVMSNDEAGDKLKCVKHQSDKESNENNEKNEKFFEEENKNIKNDGKIIEGGLQIIENQGEVIEVDLQNIEYKEIDPVPEEKPQPPEPFFLKRLENNMLKIFSKASSTRLGTFIEGLGKKLIEVSDQITMEVKELHK